MHCGHAWIVWSSSSFKSRNMHVHVLIHALYCYTSILLYCLYWYTYHFCTICLINLNFFSAYCIHIHLLYRTFGHQWRNKQEKLSKTAPTKTLPVALNSEFCASSLVSFPSSFQAFQLLRGAWKWGYILLPYTIIESYGNNQCTRRLWPLLPNVEHWCCYLKNNTI